MPSTAAAFRALNAQRRIAYEAPWSHAVLRALELDAYLAEPVHSDSLLAQALGLTTEQVAQEIRALSAAGQLHWDGQHYKPLNLLTVDTRDDSKKDQRLKTHWAETTLGRFNAGELPPDGLFSYNLFAISHAQYDELRALHLDYYHRVRGLVEAANGADRVVVMNLQLVPLERPVKSHR